jgi:hypothetical protein
VKEKVESYFQKCRARLQLALVVLMLTLPSLVAQAQTEVPEITIDTSGMITNLNTWLGIFGPIMFFIGMIPVALGLLRYLLGIFKSSFGSK